MLIEALQLGPAATNCYLYGAGPNRAVIIDAAAEPEAILARLRGLSLQLTAIVNTHGHLDHVGANASLHEAFDVPILIGEGDAPYLGPEAEPIHRRDMAIIGPEAEALFQAYYSLSPPADGTLREGDDIPGTDLKAIETPGHTAGGISLQGEGVLFVGDTLFAGSVGRTDLTGGDEGVFLYSVKSKILALPGETAIFPGHGPSTTVREELLSNPYLK